ncbi:hypothetical protein ACNFU2_08140 [Chryseobacterium sp. PTM-20240506]|uniref:hypothetical protein n=1 Tax=unclassified Chryseobacterium TaxID=2593645 RepID=UPI0023596AEA|nr:MULTISPECIES: hypothetical protein [unclassified Chryseobacterium]MDC8104788.1 hypothetical protein [Chryseobacterium sp. B21-037]MDQ1805118.1 hypothetical protein [Chryseobacterium sp. CKR4-1]
MKIIFFIVLCFSQVVFAQHTKKNVKQSGSSSSTDELLNNVLKKSKWNFDLKDLDNSHILLDKDKMKPDVLYFVDAKNFQMNINQKDCKSIVKGTYQILRKTEEIAVTFGHRPFVVNSQTNQKCMESLITFLESNLDVLYDEKESVIEIKEYDYPPSTSVSQ